MDIKRRELVNLEARSGVPLFLKIVKTQEIETSVFEKQREREREPRQLLCLFVCGLKIKIHHARILNSFTETSLL